MKLAADIVQQHCSTASVRQDVELEEECTDGLVLQFSAETSRALLCYLISGELEQSSTGTAVTAMLYSLHIPVINFLPFFSVLNLILQACSSKFLQEMFHQNGLLLITMPLMPHRLYVKALTLHNVMSVLCQTPYSRICPHCIPTEHIFPLVNFLVNPTHLPPLIGYV